MVYKNLNLFIILIILVNKVVYGQNFIPGPRTGQAAVLVGDKIYYTGGYEFIPLSNFFYLELEMNTWIDLTNQGVNLPLIAGHAADIGGINQDLIFMIGGVYGEQNIVYQFDTKTNTLTTPLIQGNVPPIRGYINTVSYQGKIYVLDGLLGGVSGNTAYNGLDILDTINLSWGVGSLEGAPPPRVAYTATLVDEIIYYIGGIQQVATG